MPIPGLNIDGVLPPFIGPDPAAATTLMSPYEATATEVVTTFGTTDARRLILTGWLNHRAGLRSAGFARGFQWLDGSFTENKVPSDLDIVSFLHRPAFVTDANALNALTLAHRHLFARSIAKPMYKLDVFTIDLNGSAETIVDVSRYLLSLFSHRRGDFLWKGMLKVRLENQIDDQVAQANLVSSSLAASGGTP